MVIVCNIDGEIQDATKNSTKLMFSEQASTDVCTWFYGKLGDETLKAFVLR